MKSKKFLRSLLALLTLTLFLVAAPVPGNYNEAWANGDKEICIVIIGKCDLGHGGDRGENNRPKVKDEAKGEKKAVQQENKNSWGFVGLFFNKKEKTNE